MAFTVTNEGFSFAGRYDGLTVTRTYLITPGSAWLSAARQLLGGIKYIGGQLIRVPGLVDPELPGMFCEDVTVEGVGTFTSSTAVSGYQMFLTSPAYDAVRLQVKYSTYIPDDVDLLTEDFDITAQCLTLPDEFFGFLGTGTLGTDMPVSPPGNTKIGANITQPTISYGLVRHCVQKLPDTAMRRLLGRINQNALTLNIVTGAVHEIDDNKAANISYLKTTKTFPAETLRYDGANVRRKVSLYGVHFYEVTYKFEINPNYDKIETGSSDYVGWNRVFNPSTDRYERLVLAKSGSTRQTFKFAEDYSQTIKGKEVSGFSLLFTSGAT